MAEGQTILDALLAHGIAYPFVCRAGNCRTCTCDLLHGEVRLLPYAGFALTDEERANGRILACRAIPESDCTIGLSDDGDIVAHPVRTLVATVTARDVVAAGVEFLRFSVAPARLDFTPGQYVRLASDGAAAGDFWIASSPGEPEVVLCARSASPGAGLTAGPAAGIPAGIAAGARVTLRGPFGRAYLRAGHAGPLLLVAPGNDVAPLLAIAKAALAAGPGRTIDVYLRTTDETGAYWHAAFAALRERYPNLDVRSGEDALAHLRPHEKAKAYVAGRADVAASIVAHLRARGMPLRDIHAER